MRQRRTVETPIASRLAISVAMFTVPDLGSAAFAGGFLGVAVSTALDVGPFVSLLGGLLLLAGGAAASRDSS